jgi:hypothetical protein
MIAPSNLVLPIPLQLYGWGWDVLKRLGFNLNMRINTHPLSSLNAGEQLHTLIAKGRQWCVRGRE